MIGSRLAHYEILELLGRGGMGEVYLARDTTLDREVALKILPDDFAQDPERVARFRREAKVLASLNHPNIAGLHGLEEDQGRLFLAMELAPGEDLSELIQRGPLPLDDAIEIARQIASGLEEAHERGIVHRDLKPANVKISRDGEVKILDFGLARALSGEGTGEEDLHNSPTITAAMTRPGTVLGTAAYMSPEQARGRSVDRRADIWAFGVILFEMLSGRKLFAGETITDVLAEIIKADPDWEQLPEELPPHVERVLRRCLAKDPRQRLRDIGEARIRLEGGGEASAELSSMGMVATPERGSSRVAWTVAAVCLVLAVGSWLWPRDGGEGAVGVDPGVIRFSIPMRLQQGGDSIGDADPNSISIGAWLDSRFLDITRDGRAVAYITERDGETKIAIRSLADPEPQFLPAPRYVGHVFFSPTGKRVAYVSNNAVNAVTLDGGAPSELFSHGGFARGGVWTRDNTIVAPIHTDSPLFRFPLSAPRPDTLTTLDGRRGVRTHRFPAELPDGRGFLMTVGDEEILDFDDARVAVYDARTGETRELLRGTMPYYAGTGHLLFHRSGTIHAVRFDLETLSPLGEPVPVVEGVMHRPVSGAAQYAISETGTLAYVPGGAMTARTRLLWIDGEGNSELLLDYDGLIQGVTVSPDGRRAALEIDGANANIWILDLQRGGLSRLTFRGSSNYPCWSPDGEWLYYSSSQGGSRALYRTRADGSGEPEPVFGTSKDLSPVQFTLSPDGGKLVAQVIDTRSEIDLALYDLETAELSPFLDTRFYEANPAISPQGGWIAYASDETGEPEIYVRRFPDGDRKLKVSSGGGFNTRWSRDGRALFYMTNEAIMRVDVVYEPQIRLGLPTVVLRFSDHDLTKRVLYTSFQTFDLSPDGQRFMVVREQSTTGLPDRIEVVVNWFDELRELLPE